MNFNLLDEGFIPVLWSDGRVGRVGIKTALAEAGSIRQIAASNPMDNVALLRFLLAVLYWCQGPPPSQEDKDRILAAGQFPPDWFKKLDQQKDAFNLLGDGKRFYQNPTARHERATTDLLQEIPTGNNFWHFRHSTDGEEGFCPACCAMGLLRLPLFSVSGLPDMKAGINGTPPIYVVPVGQSLLHTLWLNWVPCGSLGVPAWEQSDIRIPDGEPVPLLTGLTALSRRVWLHDPSAPCGVCFGCGSKQSALIRTCEYQSAGIQRDESWDDPHVVYVMKSSPQGGKDTRKGLTTPDLTKSFFRMDKPWASLFMEVASSTKFRRNSETARLLIVGFATDKAKNIDVWERICVLPADSAAESPDPAAAAKITTWNDESRKIPWRMKPRGSKSDGDEFVAALASIRPHVESRVSANIADLLAEPESAWPRAVDEYRRMLPVVAKSLAPGFTTRAVQRRNQIAGALPDMTAKPAPKPKVKKGGDK